MVRSLGRSEAEAAATLQALCPAVGQVRLTERRLGEAEPGGGGRWGRSAFWEDAWSGLRRGAVKQWTHSTKFPGSIRFRGFLVPTHGPTANGLRRAPVSTRLGQGQLDAMSFDLHLSALRLLLQERPRSQRGGPVQRWRQGPCDWTYWTLVD